MVSFSGVHPAASSSHISVPPLFILGYAKMDFFMEWFSSLGWKAAVVFHLFVSSGFPAEIRIEAHRFLSLHSTSNIKGQVHT
jgi:hypothetical protein